MTFKRMLPRRGTVIPESHRPHGSTNAALHELPAYREHTHDLVGVVLYLPRTKVVVLPFKHHGGGMGVAVVEGDASYPRGGYHLDVSDWELQRAERVSIRVPRRRVGLEKTLRELADGDRVWVEVEQPVVVEPDPVCVLCEVWLNRPGWEISFSGSILGPQCDDVFACEERQHRQNPRSDVYRAPVRP